MAVICRNTVIGPRERLFLSRPSSNEFRAGLGTNRSSFRRWSTASNNEPLAKSLLRTCTTARPSVIVGRRNRSSISGSAKRREWIPVTRLGRLVREGKIKTIEEIALYKLPIKVSFAVPLRRIAFFPAAVPGRSILDLHLLLTRLAVSVLGLFWWSISLNAIRQTSLYSFFFAWTMDANTRFFLKSYGEIVMVSSNNSWLALSQITGAYNSKGNGWVNDPGDLFYVSNWVPVIHWKHNLLLVVKHFVRPFYKSRTTEGLQNVSHHSTAICMLSTSPKTDMRYKVQQRHQMGKQNNDHLHIHSPSFRVPSYVAWGRQPCFYGWARPALIKPCGVTAEDPSRDPPQWRPLRILCGILS